MLRTIAVCLLSAAALRAQSPTQLEAGKPVAREIRAGEVHLYQIPLRTADFVRGSVEQRGISINVRGLFPDGAKIRGFSGPATGAKEFRFVAEQPGAYQLELTTAASGAGSYRVQVNTV